MSLPVVELKKGREKPLEWRHPWMFSGALHRVPSGLQAGSLVEVRDSSGGCRGVALYGAKTIALKFLSFERTNIDQSFFEQRLRLARRRRELLGLFEQPETNSFRVFFGESDGIPGLIVDRYGSALVFQIQEEGLKQFEQEIAAALREVYQDLLQTLYHKRTEGEGQFFLGDSANGVAKECGMELSVNWVTGQKTGFFLDQRENRALLKRMAGGRRVLNCFSYTGGFSVAALTGGAEKVVSVDSSETALAILRENIARVSQGDGNAVVKSDVFDYLDSLTEEFDLLVIDPPAFVKHRDALEKGLRGYKQLNLAALQKVATPGIVFTFSCSQLVSRADFKRVVSEAAVQAKRRVSILHELHQAPCHPVTLAFPEGEYLKGFVLLVEDHV